MARNRGTEGAQDLGIQGVFAKNGDEPGLGPLPRRSTRSGVVRRRSGHPRPTARGAAAGDPLGNPVRARVKDCTGDNQRGRAQANHLPLRTRLVAAHRWSREAAAARADAARYARWLVQLQRLGAPVVLLDAGDRAMIDAAAHARASSTLAYALLGRDDLVAPEPDWPVPASVPPEEGVTLALAVARHGCIDATLVAASVRAALRHAREPQIVDALREIALGADRRAAFCWRALSWLLETVVDGGSLAILGHALEAVLHEVRETFDHGAETSSPGSPPIHLGQLAPGTRAEVAASVLDGVVKPRFDALAARAR